MPFVKYKRAWVLYVDCIHLHGTNKNNVQYTLNKYAGQTETQGGVYLV